MQFSASLSTPKESTAAWTRSTSGIVIKTCQTEEAARGFTHDQKRTWSFEDEHWSCGGNNTHHSWLCAFPQHCAFLFVVSKLPEEAHVFCDCVGWKLLVALSQLGTTEQIWDRIYSSKVDQVPSIWNLRIVVFVVDIPSIPTQWKSTPIGTAWRQWQSEADLAV